MAKTARKPAAQPDTTTEITLIPKNFPAHRLARKEASMARTMTREFAMQRGAEIMRAVREAWRFRHEYDRPCGGVVLVFGGDAYGWKNYLRNPETERPGVLAVNERGDVWEAVGGDDYNGAREWQPLSMVGG